MNFWTNFTFWIVLALCVSQGIFNRNSTFIDGKNSNSNQLILYLFNFWNSNIFKISIELRKKISSKYLQAASHFEFKFTQTHSVVFRPYRIQKCVFFSYPRFCLSSVRIQEANPNGLLQIQKFMYPKNFFNICNVGLKKNKGWRFDFRCPKLF